MCLEKKSLSETLAEYVDDFLLGVYRELVYLRKGSIYVKIRMLGYN